MIIINFHYFCLANAFDKVVLAAGEPNMDLIYILLWLLGLTVLIQSILLLILWRRMSTMVRQSESWLGKVVGNIRKTIVGGGRRGKPLASLKVLEGSPTLIGQELKIYTESIKLGRDPQRADMVFYGPDGLTSISGLHARLERINGSWRIVAVSQSGSETFVDEEPLPFFEPVLLQDGQKIRLGYPAQQPAVFVFHILNQELSTDGIIRRTDVRRTDVRLERNDDLAVNATTSAGLFEKYLEKASSEKKNEDTDSIFDEFR